MGDYAHLAAGFIEELIGLWAAFSGSGFGAVGTPGEGVSGDVGEHLVVDLALGSGFADGGVEGAIEATSTKWAPWHILPADHKWVTRALASEIITETIDALELKHPALTPEMQVAMQTSKASLLAEK